MLYRPLWTMVRPKFAPKSTPSCGPIAKPHHLPHPWTRLTYDAKRHPDPIRRFSTMHWRDRPTDRQTDRLTDRSRESLTIIGPCARELRGLIIGRLLEILVMILLTELLSFVTKLRLHPPVSLISSTCIKQEYIE